MSTEAVYQLLEREPKLSDRATDQLQAMIVNRTFKQGDMLPTERQMGDLLGVSRTVVREALRALSAKGLVEMRAGARAVVRMPSENLVSELLGIRLAHLEGGDVNSRHVLEIRRILEIEIAGLAAERHDENDLAEMVRLLGVMKRKDIQAEEWAAADVDFHIALARASKNPLMPVVLRSISEIMMNVRLLAARLPETFNQALYHHNHLLEAVKRGSEPAARKAMADHLREAEETIAKALALQAARIPGEKGGENSR